MTQPENQSRESDSPSADSPIAKPNLRQRIVAMAAAVIVLIIVGTPLAGFLWLRSAVVRETEWNALWHTQTMIIRHLARTRGEWPRSWDDLEPDFQPTNHSHRTDSTQTLHDCVNVDFDLDLQEVDLSETEDPPKFISLKSGRLETETIKVNRELQESLKKSLRR
ncbi:MAG: hypothetical protein KDA86_26795 [Planctomycetaceae bacterium]|nr:hypothetical protein [Planctomycetaceae bacterium]